MRYVDEGSDSMLWGRGEVPVIDLWGGAGTAHDLKRAGSFAEDQKDTVIRNLLHYVYHTRGADAT